MQHLGAQLEQLSDFADPKRRLFESYQKAFAALQDVSLIEEPSNCQSNYWLEALMGQSMLRINEMKCFRRQMMPGS